MTLLDSHDYFIYWIFEASCLVDRCSIFLVLFRKWTYMHKSNPLLVFILKPSLHDIVTRFGWKIYSMTKILSWNVTRLRLFYKIVSLAEHIFLLSGAAGLGCHWWRDFHSVSQKVIRSDITTPSRRYWPFQQVQSNSHEQHPLKSRTSVLELCPDETRQCSSVFQAFLCW